MYKYSLFILFLLLTTKAIAQSEKGNATDEYISFYQKFLSNQKNSRCAMYPSCSSFGKMVFRDKPFVEAITLLTDRIIRCSHERSLYDVTYEYGYRSAIDYPYYMNVPNAIIHNRYILPHVDCLKNNKNQDDVLPFINYLINKEEYQSALIEIERSLFQNNQTQDSIFYVNKLLCYRGLGDFDKGIFEYEMAELLVSEKKLEIMGLESDEVFVNADNDLIHQVVYNLIDNAVKFTQENGEIVVSVDRKIGGNVVAVLLFLFYHV